MPMMSDSDRLTRDLRCTCVLCCVSQDTGADTDAEVDADGGAGAGAGAILAGWELKSKLETLTGKSRRNSDGNYASHEANCR